MPIDPAGTEPGLAKEPTVLKTVFIRCRNDKCDSMQATDETPPGVTHAHLYRCVKCKKPIGAATGGAIGF